ncbi:hypothetical protein WDU94_007716 [Cyamophila willieti]
MDRVAVHQVSQDSYVKRVYAMKDSMERNVIKPCACNTTHTTLCHPLTGHCECKPGWSGATCSHQCPLLKWGEQCARSCHCENGARCNAQDGTCVCTPGYTGERCQKKCPPGSYGLHCSQKCLCSISGTVPCNPDTDQCNPGLAQCNHITGQCSCKTGWYGMLCARQTKDAEECGCDQGECHAGKCQCYPGFTGKNCNTACSRDSYGMDCGQKCRCKNGVMCRGTDGECQCKDGWMGTLCTRVCPPNMYGPNCIKECQCTKPNTVCHPVDGCACEQGYTGADCSVLKVPIHVPTSTTVTPLQPVSEVKVTPLDYNMIIVIVVFVFLGLTIFVVLYVREKQAKQILEENNVAYAGKGKKFEDHFYNKPDDPRPRAQGKGRDSFYNQSYQDDLKKAVSRRRGKEILEDPEYIEIPEYSKIESNKQFQGNYRKNSTHSDGSENGYEPISKDSVQLGENSKEGYDVLNYNRCGIEKDPNYKAIKGIKPHRRPSRDRLPTPERD